MDSSAVQGRRELFESIVSVIERPSLEGLLVIAKAFVKDLPHNDKISTQEIFKEMISCDMSLNSAVFSGSVLHLLATSCDSARSSFFEDFLDLSKMRMISSIDKSDILYILIHISIELTNKSSDMVRRVVDMCIHGLGIHVDTFGIDGNLSTDCSLSLQVLSSVLEAALSSKFIQLESALLTELPRVHSTLMALIRENRGIRLTLIKKLAPFLYSMKSVPISVHADLTSDAKATFELLHWSGDYESFTALMCILFEKNVLVCTDITKEMWDMLRTTFNSKRNFIRKRCAFLFEKMVQLSEISEIKGGGENEKQKARTKKSRDDARSPSWTTLFMDCYGQIEGATQLHLIAQIWPTLSQLSRSIGAEGRQEHATLPFFCFGWLKVLLNMLLMSETPMIRKAALHRLLTNYFILPFNDIEVVEWVGKELLVLLDDLNYYPHDFPESEELPFISSFRGGLGHKIPKVLTSDGEHYPGIFVPTWLGKLFVEGNMPHSSLISKDVVRVVCSGEVTSIVAIYWIIKTFSDNTVYPQLSRCLTAHEVGQLVAFLSSRLNCDNKLKSYIVNGMIPLILRCADLSVIDKDEEYYSVANFLCMLRAVLSLGLSYFYGISSRQTKTIMNSRHLVDSIECGVSTWMEFTTTRIPNIAPGCVRDLVIAYSILNSALGQRSPCTDFLLQVLTPYLQYIKTIYSGPYKTPDQIRYVLYFLDGVSLVYNSSIDVSLLSSTCAGPNESLVMSLGTLESILFECVDEVVGYASLKLSNRVCSSDVSITLFETKLHISSLLCMLYCATYNKILHPFDSIYERKMDSILASISAVLCELFHSFAVSYNMSSEDVKSVSSDDEILAMIYTNCLARIIESLSKFLRFLTRCHPTIPIKLNSLQDVFMHIFEFYFNCDDKSAFFLRKGGDRFNKILNESTEASSSLARSFVDDVRIFSIAVSQFTCNKWTIVRSLLEISLSINSISKLRSTMTFQANQKIEMISESLKTCTPHSFPHMLRIACLVIKEFSGLIEDILEKAIDLQAIAWKEILGFEYFDLNCFASFVRFSFDFDILKILPPEISRDYFDKIFDLSSRAQKERPHLLQYVSYHLVPIWLSDPRLALPFIPSFTKVLLYSEMKIDQQQIPDVLVTAWDSLKAFSEHGIECEEIRASLPVLDYVGGKIFSRFFFLYFIENYNKDTPCKGEMQQAVVTLIRDLLAINATQDFAKFIIAGSSNFGKKIRLWQALCVLSNHLKSTDVIEICPLLFEGLDVPCPLSIRVHMEIFTSRALLLAKDAVLTILLSKLKNYDLSAQVVGTYLVCLGHLLDSSPELRDILTMQEIEYIVDTCTPWFSCAPGLPRSIAQLIARSLIPIYVSFKPNAALNSIYEFIHQNSETVKMLNRQSLFFAEYRLLFRCSLRGLIDLPSTESGDRIPLHVVNVLTEFLKNNFEVLQESVTISSASDFREVDIQYDTSTVLQKKHIPFSDLQLHSEGFYYRDVDVRSRKQQQDVIVCASLVDKATNLGGIARTCEVFGVRELIVPDIQVLKSEVFQNIAVSSDCWLPISAIEPNKLIEYLEACKLKGYRILGLEQTDSSRNILAYRPDSDVSLPSRCVLVLGKEKEGIPVEVLQKVDECIEIPQFGFTRSLNVHVSAALMIWELTKSNIRKSSKQSSEIV